MKKIASLAGVLLMLSVGSAFAAGTNLAWDDCLGQGGVLNRAQNCTNSATVNNAAFVSFVVPAPIPLLGASDDQVDFVTPNPTGTWWNAGTTRFGATLGPSTCPGWYDAAPNGGIIVGPNVTPVGANRIRLRCVIAVATGQEQPILADGTEWFTHTVNLKFNAGTFNNAECTGGAAVGVPSMLLQQPGGAPATNLQGPDVSNCVTWRSGGGLVCPGATPTHKATWGSIKALYR